MADDPAVIGPGSSPPPSGERRAVPRHPSDTVISCRPLALSKKDAMAALIRDISTRGVRLVLRYQFTPGTVLVLDLRDVGAGEQGRVLARVVHSQPRDDGKWLVGCALQKELNEAVVAACRSELESGCLVATTCAPYEGE
jgi:hypothetical protein